MNWIKVTDALPAKPGRYLVKVKSESSQKADNKRYPYLSNGVNIAYFSSHQQPWVYSDFQCEIFNHKPTHWMTLPEEPKDEDEP